MKFYLPFLCMCCLVAFSCTMRNNSTGADAQGIEGKVTFREGNFMPGPGSKPPLAKGVRRKIYIYEPTLPAQADGTGPLYTAVHTRLVATVQTDLSGAFKCKLAPGKYSLFTQEENGQLFAGVSNEKGELGLAEVQPGQFLEYNIAIDYKAVY